MIQGYHWINMMVKNAGILSWGNGGEHGVNGNN